MHLSGIDSILSQFKLKPNNDTQICYCRSNIMQKLQNARMCKIICKIMQNAHCTLIGKGSTIFKDFYFGAVLLGSGVRLAVTQRSCLSDRDTSVTSQDFVRQVACETAWTSFVLWCSVFYSWRPSASAWVRIHRWYCKYLLFFFICLITAFF